MPQSLDVVYIHLVFNTKRRRRWIHPNVQPKLSKYISGTLKALQCPCVRANCVEDHVHVLLRLSKHKAIVDVVKTVKQSSSKWLKTQPDISANFNWAPGYAAFSVDRYRVDIVIRYIERQQEHHSRKGYKKEMKDLAIEYGIDNFDERYFFDE